MSVLTSMLYLLFSFYPSRSQRCGSDCSTCNDGGASFCNADDVNRCIWNGNECVIEKCGPDCSLCDGISNSAECNNDPICVYLNKNDLCRLENTCSADCALCLNENDCINIGAGGNECLWNNEDLCIPKPPPTLQPTGFPTVDPSPSPTTDPTISTTQEPSKSPSPSPTPSPTLNPTVNPSKKPSPNPSPAPFTIPTSRPNESDSSESSESSNSDSSEQSAEQTNTVNSDIDTDDGDTINFALRDQKDSSKEVEEENEIQIVSDKSKENKQMLTIVVAVSFFLFLFMITCLVFCAWKQYELTKKLKNEYVHTRIRSIEMEDIDGFDINGNK